MLSHLERLSVLKTHFPEFALKFEEYSEAQLLDHAIEIQERGVESEPEQWFVDYFHPENIKSMPVFFSSLTNALNEVCKHKPLGVSLVDWAQEDSLVHI